MRLRNKVLIIILALWATMFTLAYIGSQRILQKSYLQLEQQQANENIHRVYQAIEQMIQSVNTMVINWSVWDDTYQFVIDKNKAYIDSNLPATSFASANLDIMLFFNAEGKMVFSEAVNTDRTEVVPLPAKIEDYLDPKGRLVYQPNVDSNINGFISIPAGILLVAANAIVTSENKGPVHGTLVMGRYFTNEALKTVSDITKLNVMMYRMNEIKNDNELTHILSILDKEPNHSWIKIIDSDTLFGYKAVEDINGKTIAILEITMPRHVFEAGVATIRYFNIASLIVGIVLTALLMYLLHIFIVKRLEKLDHEILNITSQKEFSLKVSKTGSDEVSSVALEINNMLDVIQSYDMEQKKLIKRVSNELDQVNAFSKKLKEAENLLRNVINSMPSVLVIVNNKLEVTNLNPAAVTRIGMNMEQAIGKSLFKLFPFLTDYKQKFEDSLKQSKSQVIDKIMNTDPKTKITQYFNATIYLFIKDNEKYLTIRLDDVTEHVSLQQTLTQNEKLAALGVLTAGLAHEINNPVNFMSATISPLQTNIQDIVDLLNKYAAISPEGKNCGEKLREVDELKRKLDIELIVTETFKLIDSIKEGASRTVAIVKDLRTFSRVDEDAMKKTDINEGIQSTLNLLKHRYKDILTVTTDYGKIPEVDCFPGKINQVFMNILSNAIDATPKGGKIAIKTYQEKDNVLISIKDTGVGIPKENLSKIFEPFFTTKEVGSGTGLGLSISFGIIRDHKGKIEVNSKVKEGSEFIVVLPIHQASGAG